MLVGADQFSDAGVYRLADGLAIIQTLDFFSPLVDDPYTYGQIAASNSLSDVYAMGGRPKTAMNIVAFPDTELDMSVLSEILSGGAERVLAAGAVVVGGHTVRDGEIKYGLSVTGLVDPGEMITNDAARAGDVLLLTKPLGTGFITTAIRGNRCPVNTVDAACRSMVELNKTAAESAISVGVKAATDITGFGLAGHAAELAEASGVSLQIELSSLPLLPGAVDLAGEKNFTRANATNRDHLKKGIRFEGDAEQSTLTAFLYDPQTSGGLLIAIPHKSVDEFIDRCGEDGVTDVTRIGEVVDKQDVALVVSP